MNNFQKGMQKSMTESNKIPHLYLHEEINVSEADHMRHKLKSMNMRVTMMGILMKTFSLALRLHPKMNSTYLPDEQ
jgi:2-oxoisovalerate dehydrogenase E2 component (dihydrolipoyl transacylase)